ncbi:MAG: DUF4893 domain-containing protein, partial [Rhizobiaceae bacterium]|nr:DUF4893 domain-containing protein [Rhizobiaceae bacterium]
MKALHLPLSALAVTLAFGGATPAARADGEVQKLITPADKARLDAYDATFAAALTEARASGSKDDVKVLDGLVDADKLSFSGFDLTGDWRCRTIKAGGLASLVVYGWFKCRVTDDGSGWRLEKLSGSQRTTGRFYDDGESRLIYLGSFSVNDEMPVPYASGQDSD